MALKKVRNVAGSHRAQLLNLARNRGEDFQFLLGRWVVERFLYRLAGSNHKNSFVLKGAMLFLAWEGRLYRPTKDLDLLGFGSSDVLDVTRRIRDVCGTGGRRHCVRSSRHRGRAHQRGCRIRRSSGARAGKSGWRLRVDADRRWFRRSRRPAPADLTFPVLLALAAPVLRAYPPEAVIAEKFHAMVVLGIANSRMKDFFDVWRLAQTHSFDIERLAGSVRRTFERRRTPLPEAVPLALTSEFLGDHAKQTQWAAFGSRLGLRGVPPLPLIGEQIAGFPMPVLDNLNTANSPSRTWAPGGPWT